MRVALKTLLCVLMYAVLIVTISCGSDEPVSFDQEIGADEKLVQLAQRTPRRDILQDERVVRALANARIYVSLTTSPSRIGDLKMVLRTVDLSLIDAILVVLPEKFSRNQEPYVIPDMIRNFPKVQIIRIKEDRGPVTKLIGALEIDNVSEGADIAHQVLSNPNNRVITIDDDTAYRFGAFSELIEASLTGNGVFAASGRNLEFWQIDDTGWPVSASEHPACGSAPLSACQVIEGFGGVIYKVGDVLEAMPTMLELSREDPNCFSSDDLVISYALAKHGIERFQVQNEYIKDPFQMSFGFGPDALHRGAGLNESDLPYHTNQRRYQKCFHVATKPNL